ncbi:MAG: YggT family protein [Clostridia bacterium]|nr:YggT family protein [Clostridia bacterium]
MLIFVSVILSLVSVYELILVARAICSWVPYFQESRVYEFAFMLTEPVLRPIRDFLLRFDIFRRCPIDFSMIFLFILMSIGSRLLIFLI